MVDNFSFEQVRRLLEATREDVPTQQTSPFQSTGMSPRELHEAQRASPGSRIVMEGGRAPQLMSREETSRTALPFLRQEETRVAKEDAIRGKGGASATTPMEFLNQLRRQNPKASTQQLKLMMKAAEQSGMFTTPKGSKAGKADKLSKTLDIGAEVGDLTPSSLLARLREQNPNATPQQIWNTMRVAKQTGIIAALKTDKTPSIGRSAFAQAMTRLDKDPKTKGLPEMTKQMIARGLEKGTTVDPETGEVIAAKGAGKAVGELASQEEFSKKMGSQSGKELIEYRENAMDARKTMFSNVRARKLLDAGMVTGFGAEYITGFNKVLNKLGFKDSEDAVANTEAYVALRAKEVGRVIKLFGAGTGLSDADREYAEKAAAGKVTLNEESLRRIIEISDKASYRAVLMFNKELGKVPKGSMPYDLTIDIETMPQPYWDMGEEVVGGATATGADNATVGGMPQGWSVTEVQ